MKYEKICCGKFIERPNRFVARVEISGEIHQVHVKNTGRCRELLLPGEEVFLEDFAGRMGSRKLRYSLIGVKKETPCGKMMINMDSQAPNKVVKEALESGRLVPFGLADAGYVKAEYRYGASRLDFFVRDKNGKECLVEVKGVTLEKNGVARFPDAPTERGVRHIEELMEAKERGIGACVIFVVQMKGITAFEPNHETHPEFGEALCRAERAGVEILAYDCRAEEDSLELDMPVDVRLYP